MAEIQNTAPVAAPVLGMKILSFDEWKGVDLRVGQIEAVEDIAGKDKLYRFLVDFGEVKKTIVAGLKFFYKKEELLGKKAVFVYNLAPAKLAGIVSEGMILAARAGEGKYCIFFSDEAVPPGARLE